MNTTEQDAQPRSTSPALAKARLLTVTLRAAADAGTSPTAVAVLAHILADAWPKDDGWTATTSQQTIASRLSVHVGTIKRAIRELAEANLIESRPGDGRFISSYIVRGERQRTPSPCASAPPGDAPAHPQGERPCAPRGSASAPNSDIDRSAAAAAPIAPAAADQIFLAKKAAMLKRPDWLPQLKPWIDETGAEAIAANPTLTQEIVEAVMKDARHSRNTLDNPAAFVVKRLTRKHS